MPIYEYKCSNCGNQLEVMQKISADPLRECPRCKENKLEKQLSLSGFQFKGSGWYVSDYTNRGKESGSAEKKSGEKSSDEKSSGEKTDAAKSSPPAESTADASAASKPETKPAAKTD